MKQLYILLAEDNRADVVLIREALVEHNIDHELQLVRDGGEALDFIAEMGKPGRPPCPDVMLLDLNLPKVDGPAVLGEFRKHPECSSTPVIVLSSSDAPADRARMEPMNVSYYFKKPSDFEEYMRLGAIVLRVVGG